MHQQTRRPSGIESPHLGGRYTSERADMTHTNVIAQQAKTFLLAYETLDDSMHQRVQHGGMYFRLPVAERIPLVAAALTCIAFAAEIAIKALIVHSAGGSLSACPRGHNLDKLFGNVPNNLQQAIAIALNNPLQDVHESLRKNANAFETWRYSYENGAWGDEEFLRNFVKASLAQLDIA
jgi:hypothetical protein